MKYKKIYKNLFCYIIDFFNHSKELQLFNYELQYHNKELSKYNNELKIWCDFYKSKCEALEKEVLKNGKKIKVWVIKYILRYKK